MPALENFFSNINYRGTRELSNDIVFKDLEKAAKQGDANAQYQLGVVYAKGIGVVKCSALAMMYYQAAADQGHQAARADIKALSIYGQELFTFTDLNDPVVQCQIGELYQNGNPGTDQSYPEAFKWFELAAKQWYAKAQYQLGFCYQYGFGVAANNQEAVKWYNLAAAQGDLNAQNKLGWCYQQGIGVTKNAQEAVIWYRLAADQGQAEAQYHLGECYANGVGATKCLALAMIYYRSAADQGNLKARAELDRLVGHGHQLAHNIIFGLAPLTVADLTNPVVQYQLGKLYQMGNQDTQKSDVEAVKWLKLAAKQNYALAQYRLGMCYRDGTGVAQNAIKANEWFNKAIQQLMSKKFVANNANIFGITDQERARVGDHLVKQYHLHKRQ